MPEDDVPRRFITQQKGLDVMAHGKDGWCAALDHEHMCCSIYDQRPTVCRRFVMGGAYCRSEREAYRPHAERAIPIIVI
jgi:Fe-S-cluster containining protein